MRVITLAVLMTMAACNGPSDDTNANSQARQQEPIGRYQMIRGVNPASVAVLDTAKGTVQNCFLLDFHYHCLAQDDSAAMPGGVPPRKVPAAKPK